MEFPRSGHSSNAADDIPLASERKGNGDVSPALVVLPLDYVQLLLRACKERARTMQLLSADQIATAAPYSPQLDLDVQQFLRSAHLLDAYAQFEANPYEKESPQGLPISVVGEALKSSVVTTPAASFVTAPTSGATIDTAMGSVENVAESATNTALPPSRDSTILDSEATSTSALLEDNAAAAGELDQCLTYG